MAADLMAGASSTATGSARAAISFRLPAFTQPPSSVGLHQHHHQQSAFSSSTCSQPSLLSRRCLELPMAAAWSCSLRKDGGVGQNSKWSLWSGARAQPPVQSPTGVPASTETLPVRVRAAFTAAWAVLAGLRRFLARVLLVLTLGLLTASAPAWSEAPQSMHGQRPMPDVHIVARADVRSSDSHGQHGVKYDNVRAWHKAWGGSFDELPMWTKMARERVVMQGLHPDEVAAGHHADECHAVWSNPLKYVYVMTYGTIAERTAFLEDIHAPAPPTPEIAPAPAPLAHGETAKELCKRAP
jgi:hypothetical protein